MLTRHPGTDIRTQDAIGNTQVVVVATLLEAGTVSPGRPGARDIDGATIRIERTLTPAAAGGARLTGEYKLSYTQQVTPTAQAETDLQRGRQYVMYCAVMPHRTLHALKIVAHDPEAVRTVAQAFSSGARHDTSRDRIA